MSFSDEESVVWGFGYGSNMDSDHMAKSKNVTVLESVRAVLKGYQMTFSIEGWALVEPAFSGLVENEAEEVHGVAFALSEKDMKVLDAYGLETISYSKRNVPVQSYEGRLITASVYVNKVSWGPREPSSRYLRILLAGAKRAELDEGYLKKLESTSTFVTPRWVSEARKSYIAPRLESLNEVTLEELARHNKTGDNWVSILGVVVKAKEPLKPLIDVLKGREVTGKLLNYYRGSGWNEEVDDGAKPAAFPAEMTGAELEYMSSWLDHYVFGYGDEEGQFAEIVGRLREWPQKLKIRF